MRGCRPVLAHPPPSPRGECSVTSTGDAAPPHLGFLTVLPEAGGFLGGYLVTNLWGRPLEFRLSTVVQPIECRKFLMVKRSWASRAAGLSARRSAEKPQRLAQWS